MRIAVVGATGAVGKEMLPILEARGFPVAQLVPFASARSEGKVVSFRGHAIRCQVLKPGCFQGIDMAFFDASDAISKEWALKAAEAGAWVIDNSATYRMDPDVPLLVPEVNGSLLKKRVAEAKKPKNKLGAKVRILAGPNCTTAQLVMVLKPIDKLASITRIVVSTYQSVSGAGAAAMDELAAQTVGMFNQKKPQPKVLAHQIAFNCIPHIGGFKEGGYTSEEIKVAQESRKILGLPKLKVTCTAVRVPTFSCHAESVNIQTKKKFKIAAVRKALAAFPGVIVQDDPSKNIYPMNQTSEGDLVESATGRDAVYVGRIREDDSVPNGMNLWIVSDNLRKGAALNAVQIGEALLEHL
ncbi:MAG: aspartate-semialdehyde dehydrogenase [Bdellovibrionales bacterium]|nr:aspartate-semialdehyde dehydrogenase [Bdellovibrionales bacterium]